MANKVLGATIGGIGSLGAHRRRIRGQRLRISVQGRGRPGRTPLLLINGIGAPLELFEPLREVLRDRVTVTFDPPGAGASPTPLYPPTMRCLARLVADLIEDVGAGLGTDRMDVLGLSWGGMLAQELAYRHPDRVRRLVLASTMPGVVSVPGHPLAVSVLATPARYYSPEYLRAVAPVLYGREVARDRDLFERHVAIRTRLPPDPLGYLYQLAALRRWSSLPWLHRLTQATLVLAGDDDPIVPLVNARLMARVLPDADLHVERGGGHLFLLLRAAAMAPRLESFLDVPAAVP
jgi:poly(3-hydroxyalkanoate) depolymerase